MSADTATSGALGGLSDALGGIGNQESKPIAAKGQGQGSSTAPALESVPSPEFDPFLWLQVGIGPFAWPLGDGQGYAKVDCESSQKLDEQKASGKGKAKTKQSGVESCPVDIELGFLTRYFGIVQVILNGIDPNGPSTGGPFEIRHPEPNRRNVKSIMIKKVGKLEWTPGYGFGKVKITAVEWELPKKAAAGVGTKVPQQSEQWVATGSHGTPIDQSGSAWSGGPNASGGTATSGALAGVGNAVGGFDGGSGPSEAP